jgi:hypothetical protein
VNNKNKLKIKGLESPQNLKIINMIKHYFKISCSDIEHIKSGSTLFDKIKPHIPADQIHFYNNKTDNIRLVGSREWVHKLLTDYTSEFSGITFTGEIQPKYNEFLHSSTVIYKNGKAEMTKINYPWHMEFPLDSHFDGSTVEEFQRKVQDYLSQFSNLLEFDEGCRSMYGMRDRQTSSGCSITGNGRFQANLHFEYQQDGYLLIGNSKENLEMELEVIDLRPEKFKALNEENEKLKQNLNYILNHGTTDEHHLSPTNKNLLNT